MSGAVAFVLKGYPRLSETFIAQEIRALESRGLDIRIYSLRHPTDRARHAITGEIRAPVGYLPEYLHDEPWRVLRAWLALRGNPGYRAAWRCWRADFRRDRTRNRIRRFGQALVLAHEMPPDIGHLHAHFLHTPASVARYAALIRGLKWSCSAHAKDIWTSDNWEKSEKLADCAWAVTCTRANLDHLAALAPEGRVHLTYHGLDLKRFPPPVLPILDPGLGLLRFNGLQSPDRRTLVSFVNQPISWEGEAPGVHLGICSPSAPRWFRRCRPTFAECFRVFFCKAGVLFGFVLGMTLFRLPWGSFPLGSPSNSSTDLPLCTNNPFLTRMPPVLVVA